MTMYKALVMGYFCGLSTDNECVDNIHHHCMSLFVYDNIGGELSELDKSFIVFQSSTPRERTDLRLKAKTSALAQERQAHLEWQRKYN